VSEANQNDLEIEYWRLEPPIPEIPGVPWEEMTTDEKVLNVIGKWNRDGMALDKRTITKFTGLKRTTVHMAINRLIASGQINMFDKNKPGRKSEFRYRLAPDFDTD